MLELTIARVSLADDCTHFFFEDSEAAVGLETGSVKLVLGGVYGTLEAVVYPTSDGRLQGVLSEEHARWLRAYVASQR